MRVENTLTTNLAPILLFHRPQQSLCLVEISIVRPRIERRESQIPCIGPSASICYAVGSCRMPCHPNHERAIISVIGRPEGLRCGQSLSDILLDLSQIEGEEFLGIIERWIRIVSSMLVQYLEVELIWPPLLIGCGSLGAYVWARGRSIMCGRHGRVGGCGVRVLISLIVSTGRMFIYLLIFYSRISGFLQTECHHSIPVHCTLYWSTTGRVEPSTERRYKNHFNPRSSTGITQSIKVVRWTSLILHVFCL